MIDSQVTIIISVLLLVAAMVTPMFSPFFRRPWRRKGDVIDKQTTKNKNVSVSVVLISHRSTTSLRDTISLVLSQEWLCKYEVIVVVEQGDTLAENILAPYVESGQVYVTYVPVRSLFMSKDKLAVSIGIKAAHGDYVLLTDSSCVPSSNNWLSMMIGHCSDDCPISIGYCNYVPEEAPAFVRFIRLRTSLPILNKAVKGKAFACCGPNIAFKKALFSSTDGYRGTLQFAHGEYDFLVNRIADENTSTAVIMPDTTIRQKDYTRQLWRKAQLAEFHLRKHLRGYAFIRVSCFVDVIIMYINYIADIVLGALSVATQNWIFLSAAVLSLFINIAIRTFLIARTAKNMAEPLPIWLVPFYELAIPWNSLLTIIRYTFADKREFTTHKI